MIFSPRESRLRPFRNTSGWLAHLEGTRLRSRGRDPQTRGTWQGNKERSALDARTDQYCHRHRKHSRILTRTGPHLDARGSICDLPIETGDVRRLFARLYGIPRSRGLLYDQAEMKDGLKRSCPHCTGLEVFRSRRRGFIERYVLPSLRMRAYRCIKCDTRFYALSHFQQEKSSTERAA
jgi:hypothetical protein